MQSTPIRDFIVGLFVLAGLLSLAYLSLSLGGAADYTGRGGMQLSAYFSEIGGLNERSPVTISGVRVGRVQSIRLGEDLDAHVLLDVNDALELSIDTSAAIRTSGLLGDQYVALSPGAEDELLQDGDTIEFTENALNVERLVGALVHGGGPEDGE